MHKIKKRTVKISKKSAKNLGVFDHIIKKYAQTTPADPAATLDPQSVQMGQSVYDPTGKEYLIVEDDPTTTYKTLMPADQKGQDMPEGIMTVDDSELSVDYSVQQPEGGAVPATTASIEPEFRRV